MSQQKALIVMTLLIAWFWTPVATSEEWRAADVQSGTLLLKMQAGIVTATMTGDVTTHGLASRGVVAQSSGGGGGNGGINVSGGVSFSASGPAGGLSIGVGGFGGGGGTSDTADLTVAGNVTTNGYGADGVRAI